MVLLLGWAGAPGLPGPDGLIGPGTAAALPGVSPRLADLQIPDSRTDDRADDRDYELTDETAATTRTDLDLLAALPALSILWPVAVAPQPAAIIVVPLPEIAVAFLSRTTTLPPSQAPPAFL